MSATQTLRQAATPGRSSRRLPALLTLAVAAGLAAGLNAVVSGLAVAAGANGRFGPLAPAAFVPWSFGGVAIATLGWLAVRRWAARPADLLRVLVPVALLLSLAPDLLLLVVPLEPYASLPGVVGLMVMHVVVASVTVSALVRVLPLGW